MKSLFATSNDASLVLPRLILGIVFFMHGAQLALGWFGGYGFSGSLGMFTHGMHLPAIIALFPILAPFLGGIGLILGFLTRLDALAIAVDMIAAVLMVHLHVGFFMNWFGNQKGEGYEFHLLVLGLCIIFLVKGAGALSIDRALSGK